MAADFQKKAYVAARYRVRNATFLEKEKKSAIKELVAQESVHLVFGQSFCE